MPLKSYTSGHKSDDAENPSCLMNIHWNTVWSNRQSQGNLPVVLYNVVWLAAPVSLQIPRFPRSGVRIPVKIIFSVFFLLLAFYSGQSMENIYWITLSINQYELPLDSHHKKLPWLGFELQTWKRRIWNGTDTACWAAVDGRRVVKPRCRGQQGKRPVTADCLTQCSNWVLIRQFALSASTDLWPKVGMCVCIAPPEFPSDFAKTQ